MNTYEARITWPSGASMDFRWMASTEFDVWEWADRMGGEGCVVEVCKLSDIPNDPQPRQPLQRPGSEVTE